MRRRKAFKLTKKERALAAVNLLREMYPNAICSLDYEFPFQLLVAVRLSAQCTDARVNLVTPALFERYKTIEDFANADPAEVGKYIYSCGFYKSKAESIVGMAQKILADYNGEVPDNIDDLLTLPGVGRKTANLIVGDIYGKAAIVVDTHCIRITNRLGLVAEKDPKKIEFALKKIIPAQEGSDFCHRIVLFGREVCTARNPKCDDCRLAQICKKTGVKKEMTENINSENVILIGMPGAGKSTCGVLAAKLLLKNFFDTDLLIQSRERKRLQQIIDESGLAYFKKAEEEAILSLDIAGAVIATGGSVVYSDAAMCHLKKTGKVIYLHLSFEEMQNRINNLSSRGIALENGETLRDMYDKRLPLYEKYADAVVDCCGNSIETTVEKIIAAVQK